MIKKLGIIAILGLSSAIGAMELADVKLEDPMCSAIQRGNTARLQSLLTSKGYNPFKQCSKHGEIALIEAARHVIRSRKKNTSANSNADVNSACIQMLLKHSLEAYGSQYSLLLPKSAYRLLLRRTDERGQTALQIVKSAASATKIRLSLGDQDRLKGLLALLDPAHIATTIEKLTSANTEKVYRW